ncbi:HNH endonuclease signature motif containing protein [Rhizobium sp. Leaf386]|uniref:HNH endonuclease n=1 Tax=Rhizobium sp. Leaf386 TaxID=1736359 RepID=UPI000715ABC6|nr:HNH endonuclease signature motif containing protein [Rhizobium sp. Leaf386]KQT01550.1 hypothetical protein ASG50_19210 [Rhizobium sp. Leaf386]
MPSNKMKNLRKQAAQRQGGRCFYCELPMWDDSPEEFIVHYGLSPGLAKRFRCTAEHVEARRDGGKDVAPNIVAACRFCNATRHKAKRPLDADTYAQQVRRRQAEGRWHPPQVKTAFSQRTAPPV